MDYAGAKATFLWYLNHSLGSDERTASEIYHDDAVVEFPQSGEIFRGKDNFIPWRSQYPDRIAFEVRSVRGGDDTWVVEGQVSYGDAPGMPFVDVLHFRGRLVDRETIYAMEGFPADAARASYAASSGLEATDGLPIRVSATEAAAAD